MSINYVRNSLFGSPLVFSSNILERRIKEGDPYTYHRSLSDYQPTPVHNLNRLAKFFDLESLIIKDESKRFDLKAFKGLGASYALEMLVRRDSNVKGVCSATDGNHGRALARFAQLKSLPCKIYVPQGTTEGRVSAIAAYGADVETVSGDYDYAVKQAQIRAQEQGWYQVQDTAWAGYEEIPADILVGYFTQAIELEQQINLYSRPTTLILTAGVGTWAASLAYFWRDAISSGQMELILVESKESACFYESILERSYRSASGTQVTLMAGLNCATPSPHAWDILKGLVKYTVQISDEKIVTAMKALREEGIESGETGAAGVASLYAMKEKGLIGQLIPRKNNILLFSTEGATDPKLYDLMLAQ
ncbi:MAG: pyridoxal-phosphate dependent enzyme [Cyclobacteriaceae bacterium]|nr:pyridoxal-phosphate dependent enzyme [Cyclobacteriaceae bacterium]MCH8516745.1 pyridoxal-phosphate dependent enzyme [Cyclobacteriaceae bacterium]